MITFAPTAIRSGVLVSCWPVRCPLPANDRYRNGRPIAEIRAYSVAAGPIAPRPPSSHTAYGASIASTAAVTAPQPAATA